MRKFLSIVCMTSILFTLSVSVSAADQIKNDYLNEETNQIMSDFIPEIRGEVLYSPPGEGNIEVINEVYAQINEQINTRAFQKTELISTFSVIGIDGRDKVGAEICKPYSRICFIRATFPSGHKQESTGWLYARDRVATAAHCLYNEDLGGLATSITIEPGRYNDYAPFGSDTVASSAVFIPSQWYSSQSRDYDYALIRLNQPLGDVCGYFGYAANAGGFGTKVTISGYPSDKYDLYGSNRSQWKDSGLITKATDFRFHYYIDTGDGQSGAPLYKDDYTVIGIHTNGQNKDDNIYYNSGRRIDTDMYNMMKTF